MSQVARLGPQDLRGEESDIPEMGGRWKSQGGGTRSVLDFKLPGAALYGLISDMI